MPDLMSRNRWYTDAREGTFTDRTKHPQSDHLLPFASHEVDLMQLWAETHLARSTFTMPNPSPERNKAVDLFMTLKQTCPM